VPSVLVVTPLTGLAFVSDERRQIYLRILTDDANPLETAIDAASPDSSRALCAGLRGPVEKPL